MAISLQPRVARPSTPYKASGSLPLIPIWSRRERISSHDGAASGRGSERFGCLRTRGGLADSSDGRSGDSAQGGGNLEANRNPARAPLETNGCAKPVPAFLLAALTGTGRRLGDSIPSPIRHRSVYDGRDEQQRAQAVVTPQGCRFVEGKKHTLAYLGERFAPIPRHGRAELPTGTVEGIKRQLGLSGKKD